MRGLPQLCVPLLQRRLLFILWQTRQRCVDRGEILLQTLILLVECHFAGCTDDQLNSSANL
ncbi:Uncharacterised protein [Vibrio cholerae]|nr:Uncharacterised protein [Vibrio cholerae]CSC70535.1 Uncharacterised protein [Vibrio cholerae]CSC83920.1 Uncharacterised protein [Vibrio cholerae]